MANNDAGEKTEQPTPRKREKARAEGTVVRSTDLTGAIVLLAMAAVGPMVAEGMAGGLVQGIEALALPPRSLATMDVLGYLSAVGGPAVLAGLPLLAVAVGAGLVANFAQVGFKLSPKAMQPTAEKLDPMKGFKRLFSVRSLAEGAKAVLKFTLFGVVLFVIIQAEWPRLEGLSMLDPKQATQMVGVIVHGVMLKVALVWLAIGALDYFFQRQQVEKQLKMTKDELKREMKEQEGSPEMKNAQFRFRRKLAKGGMAQRLATADVIVTNPTHFAVAIQYKRSEMHAPMVVAKGQDYLALRIREMGADLNVPIVPNPPLARALYKQCEVGDFVPRELFGAVAEVLAFVFKASRRRAA